MAPSTYTALGWKPAAINRKLLEAGFEVTELTRCAGSLEEHFKKHYREVWELHNILAAELMKLKKNKMAETGTLLLCAMPVLAMIKRY